MRIIVCGGRYYSDRIRLEAVLANRSKPGDLIITGGAGGADGMATSWALCNERIAVVFPAPWTKLPHDAGLVRNSAMAQHAGADLVIAFPGGSGTRDMVAKARVLGIPVVEVEA